jgi:hypothetical protein
VTFPDARSADRGAKALRRKGFAVAVVDGGVVQATRTHDLTGFTLERVIGDVLDAVEKRGGTYDGWGSPVTR